MVTFSALLAGHLVGDFALQQHTLAHRKTELGVLVPHTVSVTAAMALALGSLHGPILLMVFWSHFCIDMIKAAEDRGGVAAFVVDQLAHLAVAAYVARLFPQAAAAGIWLAGAGPQWTRLYPALLVTISGFVVCVFAGSVAIERVLRRFEGPYVGDEVPVSAGPRIAHTPTPANMIEGLPGGGLWIGRLERALVMLLFLLGEPGAIGFVLTAKSILRFGEIRHARDRKLVEYVLIGTFLSFTWAVAAATQTAMR